MRSKEAAWRGHLEHAPLHHPPDQVRAHVDGVERFLTLEPRSRILDLGCGIGRQTLELARRGHRVLGIDPSETALAEARKDARAEKLNVHFLKNDARQIPYRSEFDLVLAMSSSFGKLAADRDAQKALESIQKALKPGAKLILDMLNKEWLMRHFEPNSWEQPRDGHGDVVLEQVSFNFETGRLDSHRTLVAKDGLRRPAHLSLRVYVLTEIKALLAGANLRYLRCWGGFDGSAYGMDSPRLIVMAERPSESRRRPREAPADDGLPRTIRIKGRRGR